MASLPADFHGRAVPLNHSDILAEAALLKCTTAIVHSFSDLESSGSGFLPDGRIKPLFEAHSFHLFTGGKYDSIAPNLSSPRWDRSLYGAGGAHQLDRLNQAIRLDREAALKSCSIGKFQIMGSNFRMIGYSSVEEMWAAFCDAEIYHLKGFGDFIKSAGLLDEMQSNPPGFIPLAVGYNGRGEAANGYDQKLETTFYHYVDQGEGVIPQSSGEVGRADEPQAPPLAPHIPGTFRALRVGMIGDDVAALQTALGIPVDRIFGRKQTLPAVIAYQRSHGLRPIDGVAGHDTLTALGLLH